MGVRIAILLAACLAAASWYLFREPSAPPSLTRPRFEMRATAAEPDLPALEAAAHSNDESAIRALAHAYALELLEAGPRARYAQTALDATKNVWIAGNAAYMLRSQYNLSVQRGAPNPHIAALAERYFLKAKALDPSLDREKILPRLEAVVARPEVKFDWDAAARNIRRLPVSAFPGLPASVAAVLTARQCTIPQPFGDRRAHNAIRGEFFAKGEMSWAVICSVDGRSSILAFRNNHDASPAVLAMAEDRGYLQGIGGDEIGFSREILPVGQSAIMSYYRAFGGPQPPSIDHSGIDDAFVGKASVIWYYYRGKWMALQGAD
jgi:hypothetical protein